MASCIVVLLSGCQRDSARASADGGWPSYNNTLDGQRYSALREIDTSNVARLKPVCELRLGEEGPFQTGPIVVGDTMFVTTSHTTVAMNATTCVPFWRSVDSSAVQDPISVNRGAAYSDGRLYRGMPGTRLAALDASSGKVLWNVKIGEPSISEFASSAPVVWNGTIMVGLAGGDWGIRGRIMGYDASNGRELWRFNTIPTGSERGAETWHIPASAKHGGGASWTTYSLDTATGELFVPVGNPAPDFAPDARPGDNLFTNSIVVLDAKTGALKWWYQATPRDGFDYDIGAAPMLYTAANGARRMAVGSKDGHLHDVDRQSHALAFKTPVTTILNADKPTPEGVRACPGSLGGVEWNGPAFDPGSGMVFVGSVDWCATFKTGPFEHKPGDLLMGTKYQGDPAEQSSGWVTALDGATGAVKWKYHTPKPVVAGVTPTAGGLVFTGDLAGNFYALDKGSGRVLFTTAVNGAVAGGVVTYQVAGRQYVATTAGNVSRSTFGESGSPHIVVMALDGAAGRPVMAIALPDVGTLMVAGDSTGGQGAGAQKFKQFCSSCHGTRGEGGGGGPSLVTATRKDLAAIVAFVKNPAPPMPKLFPSPLSESDVQAVSEYVRTLQEAVKR